MEFLRNIYIRNALGISLAILAVAFGIVYLNLQNVDHLLVIHFTGGQGIDFLGSKIDVYEILLSGLVVFLINVFLISVFYERIRYFSYLISFFNIFFTTLILIAVGVIISVN